jgi:hypothetical protein
MKHTAFRIMIAAAAAMAAGATASAQSLKAEIPFAFQAAGARMQPGTYWITVGEGTSRYVRITNADTGRKVLALPQVAAPPTGLAEPQPALTFTCADQRCELSSMRDDRSVVYAFYTGKSAQGVRIATVALRADRAE